MRRNPRGHPGIPRRDLVLGPGQDGKTIQPEGLKASAMNGTLQRQMLLDTGRRVGRHHSR